MVGAAGLDELGVSAALGPVSVIWSPGRIVMVTPDRAGHARPGVAQSHTVQSDRLFPEVHGAGADGCCGLGGAGQHRGP
jgi:hypothetical protein